MLGVALCGTNTHFTLKWKCWSHSCVWLSDPTDCSPPGYSVHGILQARIPEWVSISYPRRSSWPKDQTWVLWILGRFFIDWATRAFTLSMFFKCINFDNMYGKRNSFLQLGQKKKKIFFSAFHSQEITYYNYKPKSNSSKRQCHNTGKFV